MYRPKSDHGTDFALRYPGLHNTKQIVVDYIDQQCHHEIGGPPGAWIDEAQGNSQQHQYQGRDRHGKAPLQFRIAARITLPQQLRVIFGLRAGGLLLNLGRFDTDGVAFEIGNGKFPGLRLAFIAPAVLHHQKIVIIGFLGTMTFGGDDNAQLSVLSRLHENVFNDIAQLVEAFDKVNAIGVAGFLEYAGTDGGELIPALELILEVRALVGSPRGNEQTEQGNGCDNGKSKLQDYRDASGSR